jgi:hypothetical protein
VYRPQISLGDALRAAHALNPADPEARETLRRMLGLHEEEIITPASPSLGAALPSSSEQQVSPWNVEPIQPRRWEQAIEQKEIREAVSSEVPAGLATGEIPASDEAAESPPRDPAVEQEGGLGAVAVPAGKAAAHTLTQVTIRSGPAEVPAVLATGEILAADEIAEPPAPLSLFSRAQRRGILSAALSTYVDEGGIDLDTAIESLAALRPLTRVPRTLTPTLRRGAQLLIDRGAGMDPFLADQDGLIRQLGDILSEHRLEILYFMECPTRGVADRLGGRRWPWRAPPGKIPVLLVTDLGIGGPLFAEDRATVREWLHFSQIARGLGHTPIGLVPYEARRWPPLLARAMALLHWSERTTAGEVRRATRDRLVCRL